MSILTITIIQSDLKWEDKTFNLQQLEEKIKAIPQRTQLVVLPEMFNTGFSMNAANLAEGMDGESLQWMSRVSKEQKIILTGSLIIAEEKQFFNRMVWMMPNGQMGYYDKRHLFAFAGEDKHYTPGSKRVIASVNGWKVNLQVCYDLRFPVWSRQQLGDAASGTAAEYDLLLYVANWPARRSLAWKTLLCARAIENQCYVVGVNRIGNDAHGNYHSGDSMVLNPLGEVLYHCADREDIHTITLNMEDLNNTREALPFLRDADSFTLHLEE
jgi:predicted amidohydrolase